MVCIINSDYSVGFSYGKFKTKVLGMQNISLHQKRFSIRNVWGCVGLGVDHRNGLQFKQQAQQERTNNASDKNP
jgi:hypothetical protein